MTYQASSERGEMLDGIIKKSLEKAVKVDGDYYEDGLLYCGNCHTKKQRYIEILGHKKLVGCLCSCGAADYERARRAEQETQRKINLDRKRSQGFPDRAMMEWTFDADDGTNPELSETCKRYVEHFDEMLADGKGLLFYGTVGTGKTFMASCIANALIDKGYSCLVTNFARITNELQSDFNKRQAYFDHLNQYSLIVLDDFASERDTEYMGEIVMNVIDARYRVKKPIIITTNLSGEEFDNPSDVRRQRVFSRLFEMCLPCEVKGKDRRKRTLLEDTQKYGWLFGKE